MPRIAKVFFLAVALVVSVSSCNDDNDSQIPNVFTDIQISLDLPAYNELQNPGGWVYLTGGSEGIIVYRSSMEDFVAFDRHCTYNISQRCRVRVDEETGFTAVDSVCCGSTFSIIFGNVESGPAERPLKQYRTIYNQNSNVLRIYN